MAAVSPAGTSLSVRVAVATVSSRSASSAVICTGAIGARAASSVYWISTLGLVDSTLTGWAYTSDRQVSGTSRSRTSR